MLEIGAFAYEKKEKKLENFQKTGSSSNLGHFK
jgi:hypothetical protein